MLGVELPITGLAGLLDRPSSWFTVSVVAVTVVVVVVVLPLTGFRSGLSGPWLSNSLRFLKCAELPVVSGSVQETSDASANRSPSLVDVVGVPPGVGSSGPMIDSFRPSPLVSNALPDDVFLGVSHLSGAYLPEL